MSKRLKELEPGLVVHCREEWMAEELLKELRERGYVWNGNDKIKPHKPHWNKFKDESCYHLWDNKTITVNCTAITFVEFEDLLEEEVSAVDVLRAFRQFYTDGNFPRPFDIYESLEELLDDLTNDSIISMIAEFHKEAGIK